MIRAMRNLLRLAVLLPALALACGPAAAQATFDPQKDIGKRTTMRLKEIGALRDFVKIVRVPPFGEIEVTNLRAAERAFTGDITLWKSKWTVTAFAADESIYMAFSPKGPFPWRGVLRGVAGGPLLDQLAFDRQLLVFSVEEAKLASDALPPLARETFAPYFGGDGYTLGLGPGLNHFGVLDVAKVPALRDALVFIGGAPQLLRTRGTLFAGGIADLFRDTPQAAVKLAAPVAPFSVSIGGRIPWPSQAGLSFRAEATASAARLGFFSESAIEFVHPDVVKNKPQTTSTKGVLAAALVSAGDQAPPRLDVTATLFGERSWRPALGFPGLDIEKFVLSFAPSDAGVKVAAHGTGRFARRDAKLSGAAEVTAPVAVLPVPKTMRLEVDEGPDRAGAFALGDLSSLLRELTVALGAADIPFMPVPRDFVEVRGAKPGESAAIEFDTEQGIARGFGVAGVLAIHNKVVGTVSAARLQPGEGIEIESRGVNLDLGPVIRYPGATVRVVWGKDAPADPTVRISGAVQDVLGWSGDLTMLLTKNGQFASTEKTSLFDLFESALIIEGAGKNLNGPAFSVLAVIRGDYFNRLADGLVAALTDMIVGNERLVASLNDEAHALQRVLIQLRLDRDRVHMRAGDVAQRWRAEAQRARGEVERLAKLYGELAQGCDGQPASWGACIEANTVWITLRAAKSTALTIDRVADAVAQLAQREPAQQGGADVYANAIRDVGAKFDNTVRALAEATKRAGTLLDFAGLLPAGGVRANPAAFEIVRLYMKGDISALQAQRRGALGIEFTALGRRQYRELTWDYRIQLDKFLEVAKPGAEPTGTETSFAPRFAFPALVRQTAQGLIGRIELKPQGVPFDPTVCERHPYVLDHQLADAGAQLETLRARWWPKQLRYLVEGAGKSAEFLGILEAVAKVTAGASAQSDQAARQQANAELAARGQKYRIDPGLYVPLASAYRRAKEAVDRKQPTAEESASASQIAGGFLSALRAVAADPVSRDVGAGISGIMQEERAKAESAKPAPPPVRVPAMADLSRPLDAVRQDARAAAQHDIAANMLFQDLRYLQPREAELAELAAKLEQLKENPASVCGGAIREARVTGNTTADTALAAAKSLAAARAAANHSALADAVRAEERATQRPGTTVSTRATLIGAAPLGAVGSAGAGSQIDVLRTDILDRAVERASQFRVAPAAGAIAPLPLAWVGGAVIDNAKLVPR